MTVSTQIIEVLNALCEKFGIVIDWSQANIMPYLEELCKRIVRFEINSSIAWIAIMLVLTLIFFVIEWRIHKAVMKTDDKYEDALECTNPLATISVIGWVVVALMVLISIFVICTQVFDIIECITLPEKQIIAFIKNFKSTIR